MLNFVPNEDFGIDFKGKFYSVPLIYTEILYNKANQHELKLFFWSLKAKVKETASQNSI